MIQYTVFHLVSLLTFILSTCCLWINYTVFGWLIFVQRRDTDALDSFEVSLAFPFGFLGSFFDLQNFAKLTDGMLAVTICLHSGLSVEAIYLISILDGLVSLSVAYLNNVLFL